MDKLEYNNQEKIYFFDSNKTNLDDIIRLEQIAAFENEKMKYRIFFVFDLYGNKVFSGLN